jgi:hypothetical protein
MDSENGIRYNDWKDAISPVGVPLHTLAAFATNDTRRRFLSTLFVSAKIKRHEMTMQDNLISRQ